MATKRKPARKKTADVAPAPDPTWFDTAWTFVTDHKWWFAGGLAVLLVLMFMGHH